ncbi:small RNA degrading nuclease 5 [Dorcoceras hygrometricum]|uniref:Small RNA degrading nuclease 5 n=1 Tax=Dorcoceras hygrometricum TaxID=472368 RepID=A0A2Z6ZXG4_9LAMI|nr:small RNA degrading nuclease 5 [Dorcoceras hygrometricum]
MKRRRVEESADGLALMTSSVTTSDSADDLREQSQESAGSLYIQSQEEATSRKLQWIQSQSKDFQTQFLSTQTQEDKSIVVEEDSGEAIDKPDASNSSIQSCSAKHPGAKNRRSSKAQQLKNVSAAKQLTIYKSWMSTAELNSNGESDKTQSTLKMERING